MNIEELSNIGLKLYGKRWKAPLAREIGVKRETVSRWVAGNKVISSLASKAIRRLTSQTRLKYRERRHNANGEGVTVGNVQIIHGDARQIKNLPLVDVLLTDPVWPNAIIGLAGSHNPDDLFADTIANLIPYLKPEGRIIIQLRCDSDPRILRHVPQTYPFLRCVSLPYAVPSRQGRILVSGDVGYVFGKPPKSRPGNHVLPGQPHSDFCPPVQSTQPGEHPCPRNLQHVEWLIEKFTQPGEQILDPFLGSGTSGVAALRRGRALIGIEIEKRYCTQARQRIEVEYNNLTSTDK